MQKELYRVFYFKNVYHNGIQYLELHNKPIKDTIENIKKEYNIFYLTDINGNVIIDNRKTGY